MSSYLFLQKMTRWRGVLFLLYQMEWKSFHNVFWCVSSAQMESFSVALTCKASPSSLFFLKSSFSLFYSLVRQFDHRPSCEVSSLHWVHFFLMEKEAVLSLLDPECLEHSGERWNAMKIGRKGSHWVLSSGYMSNDFVVAQALLARNVSD